MTSRSKIVRRSLLVAAAFAMAFPASGSAHASGTQTTHERGSWIEIGGVCTPIGVDGTVAHVKCTGLASAQGTWTGLWVEDIDAFIDASTGSMHGTADEVFTGRASDGTTGSLHVLEEFQIDGSSALSGQGVIVGGHRRLGRFVGHVFRRRLPRRTRTRRLPSRVDPPVEELSIRLPSIRRRFQGDE